MSSHADAQPPFQTQAELSLTFDAATVPLEAIERALYALADQLTGKVDRHPDSWVLTARPRQTSTLDSLEHRVLQEVNDQCLRVRIAERTDPLRNLVFALAFSRSGLVQQDSTE